MSGLKVSCPEERSENRNVFFASEGTLACPKTAYRQCTQGFRPAAVRREPDERRVSVLFGKPCEQAGAQERFRDNRIMAEASRRHEMIAKTGRDVEVLDA